MGKGNFFRALPTNSHSFVSDLMTSKGKFLTSKEFQNKFEIKVNKYLPNQ